VVIGYHLSLSERVRQFEVGLVSLGPIVYWVCKLKIWSLIVKKRKFNKHAGPPAMTRFSAGLTGAYQLER